MSGAVSNYAKRGGGGLGGRVVEQLVQNVQTIDPDVWLMMDQRDTRMIEEEILHGAASSKYVYAFPVAGSSAPVTGISVVGARELAAAYGGIRHTLVASISKVGSLFVMKSYPHNGVPIGLYVQHIQELASEPDFYEVLAEIEDMKTGNRVQIEKKELRMEKRSRAALAQNPNLPEEYERAHYQTIAGSKAYRNGVLSIIPQHVQLKWKEEMLKLNKTEIITGSAIDEKRSGVLRYAASKAIPVDRDAVEALTFDQISGLSDAAREGRADGFAESAHALGILVEREEPTQRTNGGKIQRITKATPPASVNKSEPVRQARTPEVSTPRTEPVQELREEYTERTAAPSPAQAERVVETVTPLEATGIVEVLEEEAVEAEHEGLVPVDENGDMLTDTNGEYVVFATPMAFAEWFSGAEKSSTNPKALREHNENTGAMEEVRKDAAAWALINPPPPVAKQEIAPAATRTPASLLVKMPMGPQAPLRYLTEVQKSLANLASKAAVENWIAINTPVYKTSRANANGRIDTLVNERLAFFDKPDDADRETALSLIEAYDSAATKAAFDALTTSPKTRSFVTHVRVNRHDDIYRMLAAKDAETAERLGIKQPTPTPTTQRTIPLNEEEPPPMDSER